MALDLADALVTSGAATVSELDRRLRKGGVDRVQVIAHEDDLPEVALLVGFAGSSLATTPRRMLAVLAHTGGDHVDAASLAALSRAGARAPEALAALTRLRLLQEPLAGRFALHATVRHALEKRTQGDPRRLLRALRLPPGATPRAARPGADPPLRRHGSGAGRGSVGAAVRLEQLLSKLEARDEA